MADEYYYTQDEVKHGPFSGRQLQDLAAEGRIRRTDIIWKEGLAQGVLAERVKHLFPASQQSGPPASAPPAATGPVANGQATLTETSAEATTEATPADTQQQEEPKEQPPAYQPRPVTKKKGRAVAIRGAIIVSQDGAYVQIRKKCVECGFEDAAKTTLPIRPSVTRVNFFCRKCRRMRLCEIQGIL